MPTMKSASRGLESPGDAAEISTSGYYCLGLAYRDIGTLEHVRVKEMKRRLCIRRLENIKSPSPSSQFILCIETGDKLNSVYFYSIHSIAHLPTFAASSTLVGKVQGQYAFHRHL